MLIEFKKNDFRFAADPFLVIPLFRNLPESENLRIIQGILNLSEKEVEEVLTGVIRALPGRYRNITAIFERHVGFMLPLIKSSGGDLESMSESRMSLFGASFTYDFPVEAAGLFGPSVVAHPDQSELNVGEQRLVFVFRAIGPGYKSSLVFRTGVIDRLNQFDQEPGSNLLSPGEHIHHDEFTKDLFLAKLKGLNGKYDNKFYSHLESSLEEMFTSGQLYDELKTLGHTRPVPKGFIKDVEKIMEAHFSLNFSIDTGLAEKVIYPFPELERKGYKNPVMVKLLNPGEKPIFITTCIAESGSEKNFKLIQTSDFYQFDFSTMVLDDDEISHVAIFPQKFKDKYVLLGSKRNGLYLSFSTNLHKWKDFKCIYQAHHSFELVKLTHTGSPVETDKGWVVITQATGPVGKTVLSALLFDLKHPEKLIATLDQPLLPSPYGEGLLQFGLASGGALIHNETLIVPYSISRFSSHFAEIPLENLLNQMSVVKDKKNVVKDKKKS